MPPATGPAAERVRRSLDSCRVREPCEAAPGWPRCEPTRRERRLAASGGCAHPHDEVAASQLVDSPKQSQTRRHHAGPDGWFFTMHLTRSPVRTHRFRSYPRHPKGCSATSMTSAAAAWVTNSKSVSNRTSRWSRALAGFRRWRGIHLQSTHWFRPGAKRRHQALYALLQNR
jgi:hypothetical protein